MLIDFSSWTQSQKQWHEITQQGMLWPVEKNFAAHSQLIKMLLRLNQELADKYLLTNQTDIATYYLIPCYTNLPQHKSLWVKHGHWE